MSANKMHRVRTVMTASFAAGAILVAGSEMTLARNGGFGGSAGNFHAGMSHNDHIGMKSGNFAPSVASNVPYTANRSVDRSDKHASKHASKHAERVKTKGGANAATPTDNQKPVATNAPHSGVAGANTVHPIITNAPASGVTGANTIHPIVNPSPVAGNAAPAGNTPPGVVTISNGTTTSAISNERGGLTVTSKSPGTITITNDKGSSVTLAGGSVTLSGAATPVTAGTGIQVVHLPNGSTSVAVNPPAPANSGKPGDFTDDGASSWKAVGIDTGKVGLDIAQTTAPAVTFAASAVATYGFARDGASGAYNSVKSFAKTTYDFLTSFY